MYRVKFATHPHTYTKDLITNITCTIQDILYGPKSSNHAHMFKGETTLSNHAHMFKGETTTIKTQDMQTIQTWRDTGKAQR